MSEQIYEFSYKWSDSGMIAVTDKFGVFTNPFYSIIRREEVTTNNSSTNEVINNSNKTEVTNIYNKVVKCDCENEGAEGQLRGIRTGVVGLDDSETGLVWGWKLVPEEGEPALFTNGQWVSLLPLIEAEQK